MRAHYQALAEACANFSTTQVQTMGTLGGNLGNGSPASDSAPALIAFRREVELAGPARRRAVCPWSEFFVGPGKTALAVGEMHHRRDPAAAAARHGQRVPEDLTGAADIAKATAR